MGDNSKQFGTAKIDILLQKIRLDQKFSNQTNSFRITIESRDIKESKIRCVKQRNKFIVRNILRAVLKSYTILC